MANLVIYNGGQSGDVALTKAADLLYYSVVSPQTSKGVALDDYTLNIPQTARITNNGTQARPAITAEDENGEIIVLVEAVEETESESVKIGNFILLPNKSIELSVGTYTIEVLK